MPSPVSAATSAQRYNSSPAALAARMQMFYVYVAASGLIAQAAGATFNLVLQADYDFMVYSLSATIVDSASLVVLPANSTANIQINDTGSGSNWFSTNVGLSSLFGTAQLPAILPVVRVIAKTATLAITVNNVKDGSLAAGATYTLAFIGAKLKNSSAPMIPLSYPPQGGPGNPHIGPYPGAMG